MLDSARNTILHVLTAIVVAAADAGSSKPGACDAEASTCDAATLAAAMPDVAQRREQLRARFERFASGSGAHADADARVNSQWWRGTASRPAPRKLR